MTDKTAATTRPQKQAHTPGPLVVVQRDEWSVDNCGDDAVNGHRWRAIGTEVQPVPVALVVTDYDHDKALLDANSRLLAAAYNSYDKHCGPRAVACAEADLLGEALAALRHFLEQPLDESDIGVDSCISEARAVLAKAQGAKP